MSFENLMLRETKPETCERSGNGEKSNANGEQKSNTNGKKNDIGKKKEQCQQLKK